MWLYNGKEISDDEIVGYAAFVYIITNLELLADVEKYGADKFEREIVKLCKTRGTANYHEAKLQMQHEVLENPDKFYNEWVMVKVHRSHIKS